MGSVKNIQVNQDPTPTEPGRGQFEFTDDYSVFDYGKMPDSIPNKGAALNLMGAYNFERMEDQNIPTHYEGVVLDTEALSLEEAAKALEEGEAPNTMAVKLVNSPEIVEVDIGEEDIEGHQRYFEEAGDNYVVPLEIVFRNSIGETSSIRRRTEPSDHGLDYNEWPEGTIELDEDERIVEFSTKFEPSDRYLSCEEAQQIAGPVDIDALREIAHEVNNLITSRAEEIGLKHLDGKIECAYIGGEIVVADVAGTLDENRFIHNERPVSKRFMRDQYRGTEWHQQVEEAKKNSGENWREEVEINTPKLNPKVVNIAGDIYQSAANEWTGMNFFPEASGIDGALQRRDEVV